MDSPVQETPPAAAAIDAFEFVRILLRRRWVVIGIALGVLLAGALLVLRQNRIYSARTSLIIDPSAPKYLDNQVAEVTETGPSYYWFSKEYYETQFKVITSRVVSERVVEKLGLQQNASFLGADKIRDEAVLKKVLEKSDAVAVLQSKLKVEPQKDSRLVNIVINDTDPERAALLANELAEAYIAENLGLKQNLSEKASEWLEERLATLDMRSAKSELALFDFKKSADILTASLDDRANMVSQRLSAVNSALTDIKLKIAGFQARAASLEKLRAELEKNDGMWIDVVAIPDAQRDLIRQLKLAHVETRIQCADLRERYLANHPQLVACEGKLKLAAEALTRELNNIVAAQDLEFAEALKKEKNLVALFEETKAEAFEVNRHQIEHDRLKRESENDQRLYELVLKRLKDLELSGMLKTSNARILDQARPNFRPIAPNIPVTLGLALMLGLVLGVVVALVLEWLNDAISSPRDVEERLGLPFLGIVPRIVPSEYQHGNKDLHIHRAPKSSVAEHMRAVRTNLLFMSPDRPLRTMVVTSCGPQEGKSTTVMNLGIAMAQSGSRVLLIDTDMRRPRLHRALGVANDKGVSSLIVGESDFDQSIKSTEVPGLFLLPCGPIPPNPAELLHTRVFSELLEALSGRFDRIILDSPPIGAVADALVLSAKTDGVLLVLRAGKTRREMARRSTRALMDVNARLFGAVLNDVNMSDGRYAGYYSEYSRYGSYYGERKDELAS